MAGGVLGETTVRVLAGLGSSQGSRLQEGCASLCLVRHQPRFRLADSSGLASLKGTSLSHGVGFLQRRESGLRVPTREAQASLEPGAGDTITPACLFPRSASPALAPRGGGSYTEGGSPWGVPEAPSTDPLTSASEARKSNPRDSTRISHHSRQDWCQK